MLKIYFCSIFLLHYMYKYILCSRMFIIKKHENEIFIYLIFYLQSLDLLLEIYLPDL